MDRKIFDFSTALIRCHGIHHVMSEGKEKTPKQEYDCACALLKEEQAKYEAMGERLQNMANGKKKKAKIEGLEATIRELEPKKDIDPLSPGAKSYLKKLYGQLKYNKRSASQDRGNKYVNKGKLVEEDWIDLLSILDKKLYKKNDLRIENDFASGEPDLYEGLSIYAATYIVDGKASWDWETFAENIGKPLNPQYDWQMQGYFDLTGAPIGEVSYFLVNTPESIINDERFRLAKKMDALTSESPDYLIAEAELVNNMTFDDIPEEERRLKFIVHRDDEKIERFHRKVPLCREYLFEIQDMHLRGVFTDRELPILETIEEI